jgi:hypothetical protein
VSSSGLIYAVIVALWAAYLVPMWLRRQDELAEQGSQDRLFTAVRVLTRRPPASPIAEPAAAPRQRPVPAVKGAAGSSTTRPSRRRARLLARRRRMVSVLFLTFTAGSALTAGYGMVWVGLPAVTGLLLSLYIAHLRARERRRAELRSRRRVRPETAVPDRRAEQAGRRSDTGLGGPGLGGTKGREAHDPHAWAPVPVPLPTYVTAPVVPGGAAWTHGPLAAGHPADPAEGAGRAATAAGPAGSPVYDQYTDLDDRPRAVND